MPIDSGNLALKGLDDLFSTEENRQEEQREQVQQIPIDALHPFTNHPFKVLDDEAMTRTHGAGQHPAAGRNFAADRQRDRGLFFAKKREPPCRRLPLR